MQLRIACKFFNFFGDVSLTSLILACYSLAMRGLCSNSIGSIRSLIITEMHALSTSQQTAAKFGDTVPVENNVFDVTYFGRKTLKTN